MPRDGSGGGGGSSFWDVLGLFGNSTDIISSGIGLFGDENNQDQQNTVNAMGLMGGVSGMVSSGKDIADAKKEGSVAGGIQGGLNMLGGLGSVFGGAFGLAGNDKASNIAYGAGGASNMLAGGIGLGRGIYSAVKDKDKSRASKFGDIAGSLGGMASGLGNALSGFGSAFGDSNSTTVKAGKWLYLLGSAGSMIGSVASMIGKSREKKKAAAHARAAADPNSDVDREFISGPPRRSHTAGETGYHSFYRPGEFSRAIARPISHPPKPFPRRASNPAPT